MQPLPPPKGRPGPANSQAREQQRTSEGRPSAPLHDNSNLLEATQITSNPAQTSTQPKKRKHRGGKKRRNRRQSFAAPPSEASGVLSNAEDLPDDPLVEAPEQRTSRPGDSFYSRHVNRSNESVDSNVFLDHRNQTTPRPRRESRLNVVSAHRAGMAASLGRQYSGHSSHSGNGFHQRRRAQTQNVEDSDSDQPTDKTPLLPGTQSRSPVHQTSYNIFKSTTRGSSRSSRDRHTGVTPTSFPAYYDDPVYDVNNPPSVPTSPHLHSKFDDPMIPEDEFLTRSPDSSRNLRAQGKDTVISVDNENENGQIVRSTPASPNLRPETIQRARTVTLPVQGDVCFPSEVMSEIAEEDFERLMSREESTYTRRRRRKREWPQIWVLDDWSREEKEERAAGERRAQKIREPVMIEGRLRPSKVFAWHRPEDLPYRYTYFNEEFESTIHAQTISELVQPGTSFRELFIPDPPLLEDSSESESETEPEPEPEDKQEGSGIPSPKSQATEGGPSQVPNRLDSILSQAVEEMQNREMNGKHSNQGSGQPTPPKGASKTKKTKPPKFGPRPTFWLDVLSPTDQEMRILSKAFGIHALTSEDIMMQEAREKVELFKNYYFINYRTFEQDSNDEDYLEPINMYVIVFRHGILTFHFSQIPHPANVRRRIRQLTDYLILSSDWISYAIIDDITDVYQPLIHNIEREVDDIDELILLKAFPGADGLKGDGESSDAAEGFSGIDMLRRVGECRKKVMSLYRLLGNKADVIKGFAKRCNEQWDVAPKSEIGLYLGDIQDHILTMTSNLSHYETLLSRAHSNYLAQVSIRMNERQEQTSDILNKLTVLGTIVLPMNIICGMWGMNVKVPGQEIDNLWWFWGITAGLILFAVTCFLWCKRVYGIV